MPGRARVAGPRACDAAAPAKKESIPVARRRVRLWDWSARSIRSLLASRPASEFFFGALRGEIFRGHATHSFEMPCKRVDAGGKLMRAHASAYLSAVLSL